MLVDIPEVKEKLCQIKEEKMKTQIVIIMFAVITSWNCDNMYQNFDEL
jgi:hypothetical protein